MKQGVLKIVKLAKELVKSVNLGIILNSINALSAMTIVKRVQWSLCSVIAVMKATDYSTIAANLVVWTIVIRVPPLVLTVKWVFIN